MGIENLLAQGYRSNIEPYGNALMRAQQYKMQQAQMKNALMQGEDLHAQRAAALQQAQAQAAEKAGLTQRRAQFLDSVSPAMGPARPVDSAQAMLAGMQPAEIEALRGPKPASLMNVAPGGNVFDPSTRQPVFTAPFKPDAQRLPAFGELQTYRDGLPPGDPRRREVDALIANQTRPPKYAGGGGGGGGGGAVVSVDAGSDPAQTALNKRFGKPEAGRRWKLDGSLEPIPGGSADAKMLSGDMGKGSVNDVVSSLRDMYTQLDEAGGITNPKKGSLGNMAAGISTSGPGQAAGRLFGTQNQSLRNTVAQQRPLLLQAIMKATGMSAKQMDSNAELKLYLATATDPTLDVAANRRALDMIETLYGKSGGSQAPAGKTVVRTGTANGRKVVQYSDGSTAYAD